MERKDFGILVLNMILPGKTGLHVLRKVRESHPYIESIVITVYLLVELVVEAMKLGAVDYLIKPVMLDDLERLIREDLLKGKGGHQEDEGLPLL